MKYKFTKKTKEHNGRILKQIIAVKLFDNIRKGEVGGWIEDEKNLSHDGNCWVSDKAKVYDNAQVSGEARVSGKTQVFGSAQVDGNIHVSGKARIWK